MSTPVHKATEKSLRKSQKNEEQDAASGLAAAALHASTIAEVDQAIAAAPA